MRSKNVKTVALVGRYQRNGPITEAVQKLIQTLVDRNLHVVLSQSLAMRVSCGESSAVSVLSIDEIKSVDLAIVVGGDGTFIRAARHFAMSGTPLLGVNLGRVGFLTDVSSDSMVVSVSSVLEGKYQEDHRLMLQAMVQSENESHDENMEMIAINDIVVSRGERGVLLDLTVAIDDRHAYDMRADGVVIATPSGSTAYAMAAGGPILEPQIEGVSVVPLCPHSLTHRPLVTNPHKHITIQLKKTDQAQLHVDGQDNMAMAIGDIVTIRKSHHKLIIWHPDDHDYYQTLRHKLHWSS